MLTASYFWLLSRILLLKIGSSPTIDGSVFIVFDVADVTPAALVNRLFDLVCLPALRRLLKWTWSAIVLSSYWSSYSSAAWGIIGVPFGRTCTFLVACITTSSSYAFSAANFGLALLKFDESVGPRPSNALPVSAPRMLTYFFSLGN